VARTCNAAVSGFLLRVTAKHHVVLMLQQASTNTVADLADQPALAPALQAARFLKTTPP
jgi:hypothetical protein